MHAVLGASVRAAGESNKALKKGRIKGEMDGSGEGEEGAGGGQWWILLIAIVIPPLQKMATSIKSLMIPALCHGGWGPRCLSESRESAGECCGAEVKLWSER